MTPSHFSRPATALGAVIAPVLAALALAGCGGGSNAPTAINTVVPPVVPPSGSTVEALYVADTGNKNIQVIGLSASGTPSQLGTPASPPPNYTPQDIVLEPQQRFVLVASSGYANGILSAYRVNADHSLPSTPTSSVTFPGLTSQTHSALTATVVGGNVFVYVAGTALDGIYAFQLNTSTGALTSIPNAAPTTEEAPASLQAFNINGSPFLLVGDVSPIVTDFAINSNGTLSSVDACAAGNAGPVLVAAPQPPGTGNLTQNDVYAYDNGAQQLYSYQIAANGVMTMLPTIMGPSPLGSFIANPNGTALYATELNGGSLYAYPISTTGSNAGQPGSLVTQGVAGETEFQGAATDGHAFAALDLGAGRVDVFSLNASGSFGAAGPSYSLTSGTDPVAVAIGIFGG